MNYYRGSARRGKFLKYGEVHVKALNVLGRGHGLNRTNIKQGRFKVVQEQFTQDGQEGGHLGGSAEK